jgi:mRNA interferase RelE/StbE
MIVHIDKSFEKDAKSLPVDIQLKIKEIILHIQSSPLSEINAEKLSGYKNAYRIRLGNYRIGFYKEGDAIVLSRILDRKEIYRYFPK